MMYIGQMYRESHNSVPHSLFALMSDDVSHTACDKTVTNTPSFLCSMGMPWTGWRFPPMVQRFIVTMPRSSSEDDTISSMRP